MRAPAKCHDRRLARVWSGLWPAAFASAQGTHVVTTTYLVYVFFVGLDFIGTDVHTSDFLGQFLKVSLDSLDVEGWWFAPS